MYHMCISGPLSISTFVVSIISSIILIFYGKKKYYKENLIMGLFFIYIAGVQLFEYVMWIDKGEYNNIATKILPFYIYIEPLILYHLKLWILNKTETIWEYLLEVIYILNFIYNISSYYIENPNDITKSTVYGLNWKWILYLNWNLYYILSIITIFIYFPFEISIPFFIFSFLFLIISYLKRYNTSKISVGSLWCLLSASIPIFMIFFEYLFIDK